MKKPFLSVIMPCYNEEENLKRGVLGEVHAFFKNKSFGWEVIISDDGSTDNSFELVEKQIKDWSGFSHLKNPHGGKPSALRFGVEKAKGKYVLFTDVDQSTPIDQVDKLLPSARKGVSVVIGSRGFSRKNYPFYRRLGGAVFSLIRRALILPGIRDTQCGFKLFETKVLRKAFPKLEFFKKKQKAKGWTVTSYDVELLHILEKMGCQIKEVEVKWHDKDVSTSKGSGISKYIKESKQMFFQIIRIKLNDLKGLY